MNSLSCSVSEQDSPPPLGDRSFTGVIGSQEARKLRARQVHAHAWPALGMLGLIGWSVCLPTLLGAWVGRWLDTWHPAKHSWTLALLVCGLCLGCANAWHWVAVEQKAIRGTQDPLE